MLGNDESLNQFWSLRHGLVWPATFLLVRRREYRFPILKTSFPTKLLASRPHLIVSLYILSWFDESLIHNRF